MREYVFIANDPGGYDAVFSVAEEMRVLPTISVKLMLTGAAAEKQIHYKTTEKEVFQYLENAFNNANDIILVTGTSWNSTVELEAIELCKKHGLKTVSILDYWSNYKERFAYKDDYCFPDYLFVMDELAFNEAVKEGIDASIMRITGNPGLDKYVKNNTRLKKALFISQPLSAINKQYEGYTEFEAFEGVLKACSELNISVNIKFHPKETEEMKKRYKDMSVVGSLDDIVYDYDVVIGMTSMGLLQCALMGIPFISYEPNLNTTEKCIVSRLNISKGVYSYEELVDRLETITGSNNMNSLPFWFDGYSTARCVNELINNII